MAIYDNMVILRTNLGNFMNTFEMPTTINELFVPQLGGVQAPEVMLTGSSDRADLLTKVYTDMGIFSPAFA